MNEVDFHREIWTTPPLIWKIVVLITYPILFALTYKLMRDKEALFVLGVMFIILTLAIGELKGFIPIPPSVHSKWADYPYTFYMTTFWWLQAIAQLACLYSLFQGIKWILIRK
jgi:hypothetical protein